MSNKLSTLTLNDKTVLDYLKQKPKELKYILTAIMVHLLTHNDFDWEEHKEWDTFHDELMDSLYFLMVDEILNEKLDDGLHHLFRDFIDDCENYLKDHVLPYTNQIRESGKVIDCKVIFQKDSINIILQEETKDVK